MNRWYFQLFWLILPILPTKTLAHGANIQYSETSAITIEAKYDDGTPMKSAQVVIYAPSDRATPWLKGTTDEQGQFSFVADPQIDGNWDVKVRQAGHGDITSIPVTKGQLGSDSTQVQSMSSNSSKGYTNLQKFIMAATGIWGFVGTALFFARPQSAD